MAGKGGAGIKGLFIDHGEKFAFGVVVLLVLFALATANWVPYGGDPYEIKQKAEQAKVDFDARKITPEEAESLGLLIKPEERPAALVDRQLLADWSPGNYDLRVPLAVSVNDGKQPLKEIQDLFDKHPIRNLKADAGWVNLNLGPDVPPLPTETPTTPADPSAAPPLLAGGPDLSAVDEEFQRREGATAGPVGSGVGSSDYMTGSTPPELMYYSSYGADYSGTDTGGISYAGTRLKSRGQFFVSVRGIVPLHELIRDVSLARNIDFAQAAAYFRLIDYQLERQTANADGTWPAADQWEVVDRATAMSVLLEVDGFDLDPVPPALTDVAVTMPLPPRVVGVWGKLATHPDIESFSLSEADMEHEMKYQYALLTKAEEQRTQLEALAQANAGPKVKGWGDVARDSRAISQGLVGSETSYSSAYEDYYSSQSEGSLYGQMTSVSQQNDPRFQKLLKDLQTVVDKDAKDKALAEYIKKRVTAVGNLLLFRYVDFAVEPGKSYRYRARLELENPNYGERVADAAAPSVVEGETRLCAWSNVTAPASVSPDTYYFVRQMDARRGVVDFDFYHYDSALGTIVSNTEPDPPEADNLTNIKPLSVGFGEPIGGDLPVWELSPGSYTFAKDEVDGTKPKREPAAPKVDPLYASPGATGVAPPPVVEDTDPAGYAFNTGDLLVAVLEDYSLAKAENPDLQIPKTQAGDLQLVDAVLVQKKDGQLTQIDTITQTPWKDYMAHRLTKQNEPWRELKAGPPVAGETCPCLASLYGEMGSASTGEGGERRSNTRTRSLLRKSGSRADAGTRAAASRGRTGFATPP